MAVIVRAFAVAAFRFLLVSLLAITCLGGVAFLIAQLIAWLRDGAWDSPQYLTIGLACGLIFGLFGAVFHLRRETRHMPISQRETFLTKAKKVLQEMGYALTSQHANALTFRPRFHSYLFGGGIHIALGSQDAKLTGPRVSLDIFRRCWRLMNHVQRMQSYLQEHRKFADNVLKRAELKLRLTPEQFEAVRKNVIDPLEKEAVVVCELNLLVQSENGLRENTLEFQVREWLQQEGIDCEIHKDLVQFTEVVHPELETEAASH
jgi:hypothetical protein